MDKKIAILPACALMVAALASCQKPAPCPTCPPPPPPPVAIDVKAEEDAIRAQVQKMNETIAAKDAAATTAFYAEDASFMAPNEDTRTGAAIGESWANFVKLPGVTLTISPTNVEVDRDAEMAIDSGTYQFAYDGPKGKVEDHGKYLVVWEKKDGQWKIASDIYNSSVPMPMEAAAPEPAKK
ncbi:MAG TPA: nuclear transport factor 2 family protein [Candidatus Binatia bacterium]|nr:nuclear transport factor 2 family protein [Candidatus Binatia bacterium]